ncbi:MAG: outer membrane beta-barrel protein [Alistipes sp.]|nr:outer membrane beta-barrel protein [Alistipes sp.]
MNYAIIFILALIVGINNTTAQNIRATTIIKVETSKKDVIKKNTEDDAQTKLSEKERDSSNDKRAVEQEKKLIAKQAEKTKLIEELEKSQKGFQQSVEFNLSTVSNKLVSEDGMKISLGLDYIGGYRFSNAIYLGAGLGFEYHKYGTKRVDPYYHLSYNRISFPLYIHFRYYITNSRLQPFLYMSAGGNFGPKGELQFSYNDVRKFNTIGGLLVPGFGLNYRISARCGLYLGVSYSLRTLPAVESYSIEKTTLQTSLFHGATIKLGCTF